LIFVLVVTAVLQIKYLNKALQRFDSTEVIPTQFVLFTVSAIIGSAVLYHDFDGMDMEQMSRFMSGCSIEFLGVYLITSKRTKRINSPALSISADSGTAVSYTDEEEALDRVDALPSEQSTPNTPIPTESRRNAHKRMGMINPNMAAPFIIRSSPPTHDTWPDANKGSLNHRRQSSVFRGISMASQLLDRNDEPPIQLPSSSPRQSGIFNNPSHHRRGDSALGNILSGLSSVITPHSNYDAQEADAVEIEIPTPSTFHHDESERELLPLNRKRNSKLDIEQDTEDRDLS
jgi:hypothetical protein